MSSDARAPSAERWQAMQSLFAAALDRPADEREAFVQGEAADDAELVAEVLSLLRHHRHDTPPPPDLVAHGPIAERDEAEDRDGDLADRRLGPYRLVRRLGRGGMGDVFLAHRDDGEYRGAVAIKVVRRDLASAEARRRFLRERQLLADLDHPHIASLRDAGTTDEGEPYLVMDYVEGEPIDAYCRRRNLSLGARLELLRRVCLAVHAAHQALVVHRDLKPGNILVCADGSPRLLDFGIAKLLDDDSLTRLGSSPRTPAYASPEQIRGRAITTAADIYALGVLLYELLVGRRPFDDGDAVEARICDGDIEAPSRRLAALDDMRPDRPPIRPRQLRGDLDGIALQALAHRPEDRYGSAAEMAEDLSNVLAGRPVRARRGSALYHALKFARRHRLAVALVAVITVLLAAFAVTSSLQSKRLAREAERVRALNAFFQETLGAPDPFRGQGRDVSVADALQRAAGRIDEAFAGQPDLAASAKHTLGTMYIGLGSYWEAEPLLVEALDTRRGLEPVPKVAVAETATELARLWVHLGRHDEAEPLLAEALASIEDRPHLEPRQRAASLRERAWLLHSSGEYLAARDLYRDVFELRRRLDPEHPDVAASLSDLAGVESDLGNFDEAERLYTEALDLGRRVWGPEHPSVAIILGDAALMEKDRGQFDVAETLQLQSLEIQRRTLGDNHPEVAVTWNNLGTLRGSRGDSTGAKQAFEQALGLYRSIYGDRHPTLAITLSNLGGRKTDLGELDAARRDLEDALTVFADTVGEDHIEYARALTNLSHLEIASERYRESIDHCRRAGVILEERLGPEHAEVATCLNNAAVAHFQLGELTEAASLLRRTLEIEEAFYGADHPAVAIGRLNLGRLLVDLGRLQEAEGLLDDALRALQVAQGDDSLVVGFAHGAVGDLHTEAGRHDAAREALNRAIEIVRRGYGDRHPELVVSLVKLARVESHRGKIEAAEALYWESLDILGDFPDLHTKRARALAGLAGLVCDDEDRSTEATVLFEQAFEATRLGPGEAHPDWQVVRNDYGACLASLGRRDEAEAWLATSHAALHASLGERHRHTRQAARNLDRFRAGDPSGAGGR